jgi:peptidoglycan/xylan/chitin deacetylase (PgdA/CDA1 family)
MPPAPRVAAFAWHEVTDAPGSSGFQRPGALRFALTPRTFARGLQEIARVPYAPAPVTALDLTLPGQHVLLTFDDGGKSALYVAEELNRRGWRAHFFIVTSLIGGRTFLGPKDIRHLRSAGHVIGSHSHTHPNIFRELSPERMAEEWRISAELLADLLGEPCLTASVPGGDISRRVLESGAEAGFTHLFTIEPRVRPFRLNDCWILGRFTLKESTSQARIHDLVNLRGWTSALVVRQLKVLARRGFPTLYRRVVARRTREWARSA